jgi:NADPH-dependent 2,4-dienoyl-CoA reductase/sulfur reductase-like enzyme
VQFLARVDRRAVRQLVFAYAARERECRVTCIEYQQAPLAQALGAEIGARFASWWDGIDLRTGQSVASVEDGGVMLSSGEFAAAG